MRKLATVRRINSIQPIENSDFLELAQVDGWKVVVKKGEYSVGDLAVYCEIDSWIPTEVAPFLTKADYFPKEFNGIKGERLRTVKLRGQVSQGLLLPNNGYDEGQDVTDILGITKWELPEGFIPSNAKGTFPSFFPKTDQERIQNCFKEVKAKVGELYEITEKLEGQSFSAYYNNGEFGVCSRNLELKEGDGTFWNTANKYKLKDKLTELGLNVVIQGEQVGGSIQGNIYKLQEISLYVYDIYLIDEQRYMQSYERQAFCEEFDLLHVPVVGTICFDESTTCDTILQMAEGKSLLKDTEREGLVFKQISKERFSFKAISNKYLLKEK